MPISLTRPETTFKSAGEFLRAVRSSDVHKRIADPRLIPLQATAGSDEGSTISDPHGGFMVPLIHVGEGMLSSALESDPASLLVTRIPMPSGEVVLPARTDKNHTTSISGGLIAGRKLETVAATSSRMQMEQVKLKAKMMYGYSFATSELVDDSWVAFSSLLERGFRDEFAGKILDERINGSGIGEMLGILKSAALISVSGSQTADTIKFANLAGMRSRCWHYGEAIWMCNHDTYNELYQCDSGGGNPAIAPAITPGRDGSASELCLGRPIYSCEFCATLGDVGDIILVNWREYLEGTRQPFSSDSSIYVRWMEHETAFRFYLRNDGCPWWRAALTPAKSSTTLSPYVTLAARA